VSVAELFLPLVGAGFIAVVVVMLQARISAPMATRLAAGATISIGLTGFIGSVLVAVQFWTHAPFGFTSNSNWAVRWAHWCDVISESHTQYSAWSGLGASSIVFIGIARSLRYCIARRSTLDRQASLVRVLGATIAVADDPAVFAYSIPGRNPFTILSSGLVAALDEREQQVVLAHEEGHHRFRHDRYIHGAVLATKLFPLAAPLRQGLEHAVERWADEHAGAVIGDREFVAITVARTALLASHTTVPVGALGFTKWGRGVVGPFATTNRVRSLLRPVAPIPTWALLAAALVVGALGAQVHHFESVLRTLCQM
jgi:Zn-dependent protease with chaperone function